MPVYEIIWDVWKGLRLWVEFGRETAFAEKKQLCLFCGELVSFDQAKSLVKWWAVAIKYAALKKYTANICMANLPHNEKSSQVNCCNSEKVPWKRYLAALSGTKWLLVQERVPADLVGGVMLHLYLLGIYCFLAIVRDKPMDETGIWFSVAELLYF